jgi:hypothetical protein
MTSCATAVAAPASAVRLVESVGSEIDLVDPAVSESGPRIAPEFPPPRA